jgi:BolA protein
MENYLDTIKKKISDQVKVENIEIINNSKKHERHKFFNKEKYHIELIIKSNYLKNLSRIEAHKKIMSILDYDLKSSIHALEIKIN